MMVTAEEDSSFVPLLATLQSEACPAEDKVDAYLTCSRRLKEGNVSKLVEELAPLVKDLLTECLRDVNSEHTDLRQASLQMLGFCLFNGDAIMFITVDFARTVIHQLCDLILKTTDKSTCTRALWCLAKQSLPAVILEKELHRILCAIEHGQNNKNFQSMTVEHEGLNATIRLLEQLPQQMEPHAVRWGKLVYPLLLHGAPKLRERALVAVDLGMPAMLKHREELGKTLMADLKALLIAEMKKMMNSKNESHVMTTWSIYVTILGKMLHHGSLINQLLPIVEQGFKNQSPEIKRRAYRTWETLIDNFALTPEIVKDHKRVKLLMQVFKINNAKVEDVALDKMRAWWHFIVQLRDGASLYFEQVCQPLLQFSINGAVAPTGTTPGKPTFGMRTPKAGAPFTSPNTPQLNISGSTPTPYLFRKVQRQGAEALALLLHRKGEDDSLPKVVFTLELLNCEIVSGATFFLKHATPFITATKDSFVTMGNELGEPLLLLIWQSLVGHLRDVLEGNSRKDAADPFTCFLAGVQEIVQAQSLPPLILLKLLQATLSLPPKALASSAYCMGHSSEIMEHCPVLALMEQLFHHRLLETCITNERFFSLLEKLVECGFSNTPAALGFCHAAVSLLEKNAYKVENVVESLWRMWSIIASPLLEHIMKSNEVNQGNNLEHDFSCLYEVLIFPVRHLFTQLMPQATSKALVKSWGELYGTFARLAAMVPNAEANVCCEDLCAKVLQGISEENLTDGQFVDDLIQLCLVMVDAVDFSTFSNQGHFGLNSATPLSPAKFAKRRQRPLGNLHSLVLLLERLTLEVQKLGNQPISKKPATANVQMMVLNVVQIFSTLFTHIPLTSMITPLLEKLAAPIGMFYEGAASKSQSSKVYSQQVVTKLEKLWTDIVTVVQGRFTGSFDSDFLQQVAPLLSSTFTHPRRQIRNQTHMLWNATFARESTLEYPESLKPVLAKVKDKNPIVLPGWDFNMIAFVEDTPVSQMSQAEPQVPVPNIIGFPSPQKSTIGSFLNKAASPNIKNSPLKSAKSPVSSPLPAKKKLSLGINDMNTQDFVVIQSPPSKKRILTEHQKEVLKEKRTLPAMYNNLDASQDVSLSQFTNASQDAQIGETPTPEVQITPFPFAPAVGKKSEDCMIVGETTAQESRKSKRDPPKKVATKDDKIEIDLEGSNFRKPRGVKSSDGPVSASKPGKRRSVRFSADEESVDKAKNKIAEEEINVQPSKDVTAAQEESDRKEKRPVRKSRRSILYQEDVASETESDNSESLTLKSSRKSRSSRRDAKSSLVDNLEMPPADGPEEGLGNSKGAASPSKPTSVTFSLDNWLKTGKPCTTAEKGPVAASKTSLLFAEETQEQNTEQGGPAPIVFAEDTQQYSPAKFAQKQTSPSAMCVKETPLKTDEASVVLIDDAQKATKNLFTGVSPPTVADSQMQSVVPDSQIAPVDVFISPKSLPSPSNSSRLEAPSPAKSDCSTSEPMVKLFRLSQEEIERYSPRKKKEGRRGSESDSEPSHPKSENKKGAAIRFRKSSKERASHDDIFPNSQQSLGFQSVLDFENITDKPSAAPGSESIFHSPDKLKDVSDSLDINQNPDMEPMEDDSELSIEDSNATIVARPRRRDVPEARSLDDMSMDSSQGLGSSPKKTRGRPRKKSPASSSQVTSSSQEDESMQGSERLPARPLTEALLVPTLEDNSQGSYPDFSEMHQDSSSQQQGDSSQQSIATTANSAVKKRPGRPRKNPKTVPPASEQSSTGIEVENLSNNGEQDRFMLSQEELGLPSQSDSLPSEQPPLKTTVKVKSAAEKKRRRTREVKKVDKEETISEIADEKSDSVKKGSSNTEATADTPQEKELDELLASEDTAMGTKLNDSYISEDDIPLTKLAQQPPADIPLSALLGESDGGNDAKKPEQTKVKSLKKKKRVSLATNKAISVPEKAEVIVLDASQDVECSEELFASENTSTPVKSGEKKKKRKSLMMTAAEREARRLTMDVAESLKSPSSVQRKRSTKLALGKPKRRSSRRSLLVQDSELAEPVSSSVTDIEMVQDKENLDEKALDAITEKPETIKDQTDGELISSGNIKASSEDSSSVAAKADSPTETPEKAPHPSPRRNTASEKDVITKSNVVEISDTLDKEGDTTGESEVLKQQRYISPRKRDSPNTPTSGKAAVRKTIMMSRASLILQRAHMVINKTSPPSLKKRGYGLRSPIKFGHSQGARPGILKSPNTTPSKADAEVASTAGEISSKGSPPAASMFRPIHLPKIYSPSASPSAGILRKRKFTAGAAADTPSPPYKQRRVSFNEAIHMVEIPQQKRARRRSSSPKPVNRCLELPKKGLIPSPLVTTTPSRVVSAQSKFLTTPSKGLSECKTSPSDKGAGLTQSIKDSQMSVTQASVHETQESQLDTQNPVYPALVDCDTPVDHILPQLTSSMWIRGLGQVVRAKNILTVGDMSALTEHDIHNLPIRSPKVKTVQKALADLEKQRANKKGAASNLKGKENTDGATGSPVKAVLPSAEDVLDRLSPAKADGLDDSIEETLETSTDLIEEEIQQVGDAKEASLTGSEALPTVTEDVEMEVGQGRSMTEECENLPEASLLQEAEKLHAKLTAKSLSSQHAYELVTLHQQLNDMMSKVVIALKEKCTPSPESSPVRPSSDDQ